jgi:hypothetical protein
MFDATNTFDFQRANRLPLESAGLLNRGRSQDQHGALGVNMSAVRGEHPDDVGAPCQQWHSAGAGSKGSALLKKAFAAFRKIGNAVIESETRPVCGVGFHRGSRRIRAAAPSYFVGGAA